MLIVLAILASALIAMSVPFAVISDVWVAGAFSVVNASLNAITLIYLARTKREVVADVGSVHDEVDAVRRVTDKVKLRRTDRAGYFPPEGQTPPEGHQRQEDAS